MASAGSVSTVTDQMKVLVSKADQLALKDAILGNPVISQVNELLQTAKKGVVLLTVAEEREINASTKLEEWLEKVNAAILAADDVLDECEYLVHESGAAAAEPKPNPQKKYLSSITSTLRNGWPSTSPSTSKQLKSVNSTLRHALKGGDKVTEKVAEADPDGGGRTAAAQAKKDSSEIESVFIKETQDVKTIVDRLLISFSEGDLSILTLVGWAETGKTALARLLYKNPEVMFYFDERIWVQAPGDLNTDAIAKRMLANLTRTSIDGPASALEEKFASLQRRLKGKRFLLVLVEASDLNQAKFNLVKEFLVKLGGSRGSKVLITTGMRPKVNVSFVYEMKLGMDDYCWQLLDRIAFSEGGPIRTPRMVELGKSMAKLCKGKALHIKLLGSLLHRLKEERRWVIIRDELEVSLPGCIPKLCFDHMSSLPLKQCFRYCSIFPKGYLMLREELIELWMAQGYLNVRKRTGPAMEAIGNQYYDALMRSSFLQVSEDDDFDAQSCKIPDVLHGLTLFTESSKDCFKTVVKGDAKVSSGDFEHLTLIECDEKLSKSFKDRLFKLRSLRLENTKGLAHFLACAHGLRALIVVDASLEELPDSIGKLIRLRYLDISRTSIVRLPDSISELYNLETLRLHDLKDFPKNFENLLGRMMHLHIQKLENLYEMYDLLHTCGELVYLSSAKASLKVFMDKDGRIDHTMLHKLSNRCSTISIHCLENASKTAEGISAWLSEIPGTEILKLNWSAKRENSIDEDVLDKLKPNQSLKELTLENFKGTRFPLWMMNVDSILVSNLVKLELENCSWCETLPPLGHLSCLRILKILGMENVQSITVDFYAVGNGPVFGKLKEFTLCGMSNLQDWSGPTLSSTNAFPYLERFEVDQCHRLIAIPDIVLAREPTFFRRFKVSRCDKLVLLPKGLGELKCLEDLELFGLPELFSPPDADQVFGEDTDLDQEFSLEDLELFGLSDLPVEGFGEREYLKDLEFSIRNTTNLKRLIIGCVSSEPSEEKMLSQLVRLTCLTNLTIWGYNQENIPDCLGKMDSLKVLKFESCRRLKYLPDQITSSLKELHISYCPLLEDSCIRGSRPEWPKVSHIQTIVVNGETIREPAEPATEKINHEDVSEMSSSCQIM